MLLRSGSSRTLLSGLEPDTAFRVPLKPDNYDRRPHATCAFARIPMPSGGPRRPADRLNVARPARSGRKVDIALFQYSTQKRLAR